MFIKITYLYTNLKKIKIIFEQQQKNKFITKTSLRNIKVFWFVKFNYMVKIKLKYSYFYLFS